MANKYFNYDSKSTPVDSEIIVFTIRTLMNTSFGRLQNYTVNYTYEQRDRISILVDRVYYSPDSLKLIGYIIMKTPSEIQKEEYQINKSIKYTYEGTDIIGFRNKKNEIWKIFPNQKKRTIGFTSVEENRKEYNRFFFNDLKNVADNGYNSRGEPILIFWQYFVDDSMFWNNPPFDTSLYQGHYPFELNMSKMPNHYKGQKLIIDSFPDYNFPASLITRYQEANK